MSFPSTPEFTQTSQANAAQNLDNSKETRDRRIVDAARRGLKAVGNNNELYEWYIMEIKQLVSRAAKKAASLEDQDGNRSGLHFGESGGANK
jgi:predicted ATP-binding protein involved in virulence